MVVPEGQPGWAVAEFVTPRLGISTWLRKAFICQRAVHLTWPRMACAGALRVCNHRPMMRPCPLTLEET